MPSSLAKFASNFVAQFLQEPKAITPSAPSDYNCISLRSYQEIWARVKSDLRQIYGDALYQSWIVGLEFIEVNSGELVINSPSNFIKEWVGSNYISTILNVWRIYNSEPIYGVNIQVGKAPLIEIKHVSSLDDQINEHNVLDPRFTFDNFVVGKPNELAFHACRRIAESYFSLPDSNPLFLYGGVGLGKTHLMQATANYITQNFSNRKVAYLSAEKFMYQYITALRNKSIMTFKEQFRSVDVLMVDDVQFISGKDSTQEEFFHTFNALIEQKKQLIISADRSPSDLSGVEERIKSRLGWGLVADVNDTTFELRLGILQAKVEASKILISQKVLEFLAKNIKSNIRELEGALNKVIAHNNLIQGGEITIDTVTDILSDLLRSNKQSASVEEIQKKVAEYYNLKPKDLLSERRDRALVRARQIAIYLTKNLTQKSLPQIGRDFNRDHTTIMHSIKQVEKGLHDPQLSDEIEIIIKTLRK